MAPDSDDLSRPADAASLPDAALSEVNRLWTIVRALSNTAHEVNNALQVIAGSAELLEARASDPVVVRRVEAIRSQAGRAAAAVEHLVAYLRAEPQPRQRIDLREVVRAAVDMRTLSLSRRRIQLTVDWPDDGVGPVRADPTRLQQALVNLLLAAEDALLDRTNAGITITAEQGGGHVTVTVAAAGDTAPATQGSPTGMAITTGAQLWSADYLTRQQGGQVTAHATGNGLVTTLAVPVHDGETSAGRPTGQR